MTEPFRPPMTELASLVMRNECSRVAANWSRGKLSEQQVKEIKAWKGKAKDIADRYGVQASMINAIRRKDKRPFV